MCKTFGDLTYRNAILDVFRNAELLHATVAMPVAQSRHARSEPLDCSQLDEPPFTTPHGTRRAITARNTYGWQTFSDPHQTT